MAKEIVGGIVAVLVLAVVVLNAAQVNEIVKSISSGVIGFSKVVTGSGN